MGDVSNCRTRVEAFARLLRDDEELQRQMRLTTTAAGVVAVAAQAGISLSAAELVKDYALRLLEAGDELAVANFENCGWDAGELLWVIRTWQQEVSA